MTEGLHRDWQRLAGEMASSFTSERVALTKKIILGKHRVRIRHFRVTIACLAGVLLLGAAAWTIRRFSTVSAVGPVPPPESRSTHTPVEGIQPPGIESEAEAFFASGAAPRAVPLSAGTRFSVEEELSTSTYRIEKGIVRFETRETETKKLVVRVGTLTIEDIGTIFTVETLSDTQARVSVTDGQVLVTWPSGRVALEKGKEGIFPLTGGGMQAQNASRKPLVSALSEDVEDWRTVAKKGESARALRLIDEKPSRVLLRADDLLLAADVMRLTGHPKRAVTYLERVVRHFSGDPRSASAAFTLGKVFLDELGKPKQAAAAFAAASRDNSPLAEEASAREVEAWSRAREPEQARAAAMRYLGKYPGGARADTVRALAGVVP